MEKLKIGGILYKTDLAEIGVMSIPDRPGIAGAILKALGDRDISVRFIVHLIDPNNLSHVVLCVAEEDLEDALSTIKDIQSDIGAQTVIHKPRVGMISIFGPEFQERPGLAGAMFSALASVGINIQAISTSIATVSCLIDADRVPQAVEVLHQTFEII